MAGSGDVFSQRVKELRGDKSPYVLAALCNVHEKAIAEYESGKARPSFENLIKIADYFDVTIDYLVGRE